MVRWKVGVYLPFVLMLNWGDDLVENVLNQRIWRVLTLDTHQIRQVSYKRRKSFLVQVVIEFKRKTWGIETDKPWAT